MFYVSYVCACVLQKKNESNDDLQKSINIYLQMSNKSETGQALYLDRLKMKRNWRETKNENDKWWLN